MNDFKGRTLRGGLAKVGAKAADFLLRMGSLMVLARLLEPTDFGLVGMVTAITGVLGLLKEFGLSTATVQRATITDEQLSTLFWINIVGGAILGLASLATAPFVAAFYHEPRLFLVMIVLGSGFLFNAAGVQHSALLQRQMRFTALAIIEVLSLLISSAISIALATRGYGYWALVAWSITLPLASTLLTVFQSGWIPGRPRLNTGMRSMMRFGSIVTLNGLVVYIAYNLDKILLGRFWGAEVVGIYGRAYQLVTLPTDYLNGATGSVAIPVLSRLQDDPEQLRNYFLKGYSLVLALTIPITAACALFANELILVIFGPKWNDAIPIFRLLAPTILVFALINPTGWLLVSLGMVGRSLRIALAIASLVITGCVIGLPYGAKGVAFGYSAALTLWVVPHLLWCFHGTVISFRDVLLVASRPFTSGIVGASCALGVLLLVGPSVSTLATLLLGGTVLIAVYVWMLLFVMGQKTLYLDLLRSMRGQSEEKGMLSS
jgi:PST family polysaccharide transporter